MTKIVATIGPACDSVSMIKRLIKAGMNVARINLSHGNFDKHEKRINMVKEAREELNVPVAIMLDTRGPEVRVDRFVNDSIYLNEGDEFTLTTDEIIGDQQRVSITYKPLINFVKPGVTILANDGLIEFEVISVTKKDIVCKVCAGGELSNRKSLNLPDVKIEMPYISKYDKEGFLFGIAQNVDCFALSFVRDTNDVLEVRELLDKNGGEEIHLVSKIENREGVDNFKKIIKVCDGAMVARGDLGVEIPFEEIPKIQKDMIKICVDEGKKVITATQMLESMVHSKRPTRAEISDVANAIYDGTSAIMLSGETAAGKFPIESVKTMDKIACHTEENIDYKKQFSRCDAVINNVADAVSHATVMSSFDLNASAIIAVSQTGETVRKISRFRPNCPILGLTASKAAYYQLSMNWGVLPMLTTEHSSSDELFNSAMKAGVDSGLCKKGSLAIMAAGISVGESGKTNVMRIENL